MCGCARVGLAVLLIIGTMPGQSKSPPATTSVRPPTAHPKPRIADSQYLTTSFDINTSNLGQNFVGHHLPKLYETLSLSAALSPKSDFESTAAFQARMKAFYGQPVFGTLKSTDRLALILRDPSTVLFLYDADRQTLDVRLTSISSTFYRSPLDTLTIVSFYHPKGSYVGTNAFGATADVRKAYVEDYSVAFSENNLLFRSDGYSRRFIYTMAMSPDEAKALIPDARVLLLCHLAEPWHYTEGNSHDATLSEPFDTVRDQHFVVIVPEQLWVFNRKTGAVVAKVSQSDVPAR